MIEKCNAKQLEAIEYYSPNLIADTDYIWKRIYEQEFKKTEEPDEDESYRELYYVTFYNYKFDLKVNY